MQSSVYPFDLHLTVHIPPHHDGINIIHSVYQVSAQQDTQLYVIVGV